MTDDQNTQAPQSYAQRVTAIFKDALFLPEEVPDGKPPADAVLVDGITHKFGFHKQRLESHRAEVRALLGEILHDNFHADRGGGWSFLMMPEARDGTIWGQQRNCQELLTLAIGLGMAKYALEREMWAHLPGSVPYVVVNTTPA